MHDASKRTRAVLIGLLLVCLLLPLPTTAELSTEEQLAEQGLTLLALRNDTIDTNQDGDIDAVRVVVVLNSTAASNDLIVKLRGLHKEREVLETQEISFQAVSYTHLRAHETDSYLVCRLLLEKKK